MGLKLANIFCILANLLHSFKELRMERLRGFQNFNNTRENFPNSIKKGTKQSYLLQVYIEEMKINKQIY